MTYENRATGNMGEQQVIVYIHSATGREKIQYVKLKKPFKANNIYFILFKLFIMDINRLFIELIDLMKRAGKIKSLDGEGKKKFVLQEMKRLITLDNYIEDILIIVIDLLIQVENGELVINKDVKDNATKCFDFFKCCK